MERSFASLLALVVVSASLAACTAQPPIVLDGDDDGDGSGGSSSGTGGEGTGGSTGTSNPTGGGTGAQAKFVNEVYPSIAPSCGSCHALSGSGAPVFLAGNAEGSYNAIIGYTPSMIAVPDNSVLVLHGAHTGPALSPAQEQLVGDWLLLEVEERGLSGGGGTPPGKTLDEALDEFANCMQLTDWTDAGMDDLPKAQTGNAGQCSGCHNAGDGGAWLSLNVDETFQKNQDFPYIKRLITGTVDSNGAFDDLVPSRRFIEKGQEPCGENENCHPKYSLPPNLVTAVETFVQTTLDRWHAGQCGTP